MTTTLDDIIKAFEANLYDRKSASSEDSYVSSLYSKGLNKILEKVGEEAVEVILAAKDMNDQHSKQALINESADLFFHLSVALAHLDIPLEDVFRVIEQRLGMSGHAEKASRPQKH